MTFKFIDLFAILTVANAGIVPQIYQQSPTLVKQVIQSQPILRKTTVDEYYQNPQYSYSYDIQDVLAGDSKSQQKSCYGDLVHGQYTVNDADGFNDIVSQHALAVKSIVSQQPIVKTAPITYAAPAIYAQSTRLTNPVPSTSYTKSDPFAYVAPNTNIKSSQD